METVLTTRKKMAEEYKPNPFAVANGGLHLGDRITADWVRGCSSVSGCHVRAWRGQDLLMWKNFTGFGRDLSGKFLYAPYLETRGEVSKFVSLLAVSCGFGYSKESSGPLSSTFVFSSVITDDVRRIMDGDILCFCQESRCLKSFRSQGTIDMNLYKPLPEEGGVVLSASVSFVKAIHHFGAIAHILAEANGFKYCVPMGGPYSFQVSNKAAE